MSIELSDEESSTHDSFPVSLCTEVNVYINKK
jgi:hypothetical protein